MDIYRDSDGTFTDVPTSASAERLQMDLQRLTQPPAKPAELPPAGRATAIPNGKGLGAQTRAAGIASPLTEEDAATREWHATPLYSTDGLLSWPQLKALHLKDANGATVVIQFGEAT